MPTRLFGAHLSASGWEAVEPVFRQVASWFTDTVEYEFEALL